MKKNILFFILSLLLFSSCFDSKDNIEKEEKSNNVVIVVENVKEEVEKPIITEEKKENIEKEEVLEEKQDSLDEEKENIVKLEEKKEDLSEKKDFIKPEEKENTSIFRFMYKERIKLIDPSIDVDSINFNNYIITDTSVIVGDNEELELDFEKYRSIFNINDITPNIYEGEKLHPIKREVDMSKKHIVFSFDDGPRNKYHGLIRDLFTKYNQSAVFAVLGLHVEHNRDMLIKTYLEGHQIINHSYKHPNFTKLSKEEALREYFKGEDAIFSTLGYEAKYFRPPYGAINKDLKKLLGGRKNIVLWNIDSEDWKNRNKEEIINRVLPNVRDGSVVLFHDVFKESYEAVEYMVPILIDQGYQFITYEDMLKLNKR